MQVIRIALGILRSARTDSIHGSIEAYMYAAQAAGEKAGRQLVVI
jgi:hypothetical protein